MKKLLLFCLCCFSLLGFLDAQENNASLRMEFSSNSIFPLSNNIRTFIHPWNYYVSKRKYNYSLQLSAFHRISRRLDVGLGMGYANLDAYTTFTCDFCLLPVTDRIINPREEFSKFRAIEMPLELRIHWFKNARRISPYTSVGMTGRVYLLYTYSATGAQIRIDENDFSLGLNAGLGTRFLLGEQWSINLATHFMRSKYQEAVQGYGRLLPPEEGVKWLNECYVKVGLSRAF